MFLKHFLRLTLLLSLSTLTLNSAADDDGTWTYTLSGDEATITGCVATCPTQLVIPSTVDGYSVTIIGNDAFASHQLTSVTIPGSVTTFQQGAFYNNQLASVTIPDGVTTIDQQVFRRNQLTSVTIPYGVTTIGLLAFSENQLASVAFEGNRPSVSGNAFVDNPDLYSITYCLRRMGWPGDPILNGLVDVTPMGIDCSVSNDSDGDGIPDTLDAFPNDPAASVDTDGDGMPDDWNPGYLAQDSTSQPPLELDYDDDNDQRLDFRDEDSLDPATGRLTLATALERVIDQRLRQCLSDATQGFQFADEATHLYCVGEPWGDGDLYSLKGIEGFSGLEGVEIQNANLDDVSPLKWLASLSDLTLDNGYYGEDLSPLGQIQTLNRLQLVSSTGDLTWLPSLTALTGFYFAALLPEGGEPSIDLTKISGLTNLVTLSIYHGYYTDIAPLGSLTNLTTLILGNAKNLEWDLLKALTNLERLEVFANYGYFDVSILAAFPKLTAARIGAGYPELLEDLYNLPIGLTEFGIYNANITDFGWVARLSNLKRLQLGVSEGLLIEDLSQLKSIDYLDELNLWYAQVTRLDGVFDDWANGTVIELTGNPLLCSEIDAARQNPNIEIRFSGDCLGSNPSIDNYRYDAPNRTHVAYHYALESNPTDFPYELNADSYSVSQWGGSTAMSFFVSVNGTPQYFDYPFDAAALNEAWQSGNGIARMSTNATGELDNFKFLVEGGSKPAQVGVFTSFGLSANDVAQANRHLRVTRTAPGTGNYNTDPAKGDNCSASYLEGFSNQVTEEKQIGLYFSDLVEGGEVALFDDRAAMNKIFNCADSPTGVYDLEVVVLDGRGGKKTL